MAKEIKGFITRDDFIAVSSSEVSPLYELSDHALTYSKVKFKHYSSVDPLYALHVFKLVQGSSLEQSEVNDIINLVVSFSNYLTNTTVVNKQQQLILFTANWNANNPTKTLHEISYSGTVNHNNIKAPDYINFKLGEVVCSIWLSDVIFRAFYPDYDINIVLPFNNFSSIVNSNTSFLSALSDFSLIEFNKRIEADKAVSPTTYTKILNIPYLVPNTTVERDCYFAFNIYGLQGNYDHILKLALYDYLQNTVGMNGPDVERLFPSILNINEFFIVPRWDKIAIPAQVGQVGITSQISPTYQEVFDVDRFVKVTADNTFLRNNTYNVPMGYNNLLLHVVNGYYSEEEVKDFRAYYSDLITVNSIDPDFARMKTRTQKFITLVRNMLDVSNSSTSTEMFNKILQNKEYQFTIINRAGVTYIAYTYADHQLYLVPKYEMLARL